MYRQIFRKSLRQWQQFIPVFLLLFVIINLFCITDTKAQTRFSVVELNTENLFDTLHDAGKMRLTDYKRSRISGGVTLSLAKPFVSDIRINYEKYFYGKNALPKVSERDKIVFEVMTRF